MQRTTSTGFAPASDSDRLPQAQTWPDPGGQTGDQDWSNELLMALVSVSPWEMPL